jgi:hypothetical protein
MQPQRSTLSPAEASKLATDAYVFLYPLVFMEAFRQAWAEKPNTFARLTPLLVRSMDGPPHALSLAFSVGAWIDLSAGPVLLTLPDSRDRYIIATVFDAWGEIVAAIGTRETGGRGGRYVLAGPSAQDVIANIHDLTPISASTNRLWVSVNIIGRGETDFDILRSLASKCRATVIGDTPLAYAASPRLGSGMSPIVRVSSMSHERFFSTAAALLALNPVRPADHAFADVLQKLGLREGRSFALSSFAPDMSQMIQEGAAVGRASVLAEHDRLLRLARENWGVTPPADGATDYLNRAARIRMTPHTALPQDHLLLATSRDSEEEPLHGARRYSIRFPAGTLPPSDALWSLSAVDIAGRMMARKPGRSIGSHRELHYNPDGSLDILVQSTRSRRSARNNNWLQCPQGRFTLVLELFSPRDEALRGEWSPPLVRRDPDRRTPVVAAPEPAAPSSVVWLQPQLGGGAFDT